MAAMGEFTLFSVVAETQRRELFAGLSFVLGRVSFLRGGEVMLIISLLTTIALSRGR